MSGQENSLVHADRGNGAVPAFPASLQEIVSILTQCHRLIGAVGVFRPASAMGSGWPDEERLLSKPQRSAAPKPPLVFCETRIPHTPFTTSGAAESSSPPKAPVFARTAPGRNQAMSTHTEIERKFLVTQLPDHLAELPHVEITQGYLAFDERGLEVRLRKVGQARYLAHKTHRGDTRIEREITLSDDQFDELWPATKGRRLRKVRYFVPHDGLTVEIDLYKGPATGIMVAEIEFPDRASRVGFQKPDWLGEDVSGIAQYSNHLLATE
jgi:adenylate cyclase